MAEKLGSFMNEIAIRSSLVTYNCSLYPPTDFFSIRTQIETLPLRHHIVYMVIPQIFITIAQATSNKRKNIFHTQTLCN